MKSLEEFLASLFGNVPTPQPEAKAATLAQSEPPSAAPRNQGQPKSEAKPAPPARRDTAAPKPRKAGQPNGKGKPAAPIRREAPLQEAEDLYKKGDVIGGRYEIHGTLGKGGFGVVYLAYNRDTGEVCALKTFRDELLANATAREAFKKEALLWVNLEEHPFIVAARWVQEVSGRLFVQMDYVAPDAQGRVSLADHLSRVDRPLDEQQTLKWAIQFCLGMEHAQARGIKCHRDIKPANILIAQDGILKISDFGLAAAAGLAWRAPGGQASPLVSGGVEGSFGFSLMQTEGKVRCGTAGYMPPEVYRCEGADIRGDIYSFGLVLWQMAAGSRVPPWKVTWQGDMETYLRGIYEQQIGGHIPRLESPLGPVIERCLLSNPSERYGSFEELREALEPIWMERTGQEFEIPETGEQTAGFWTSKAGALDTLGRHEDAIGCCDKALAINPRSAEAWLNKGAALCALGRHEEAIDCYDKALAIDPRFAKTWVNKGNSLYALGRVEEALDCCDRALAIDPQDAKAWTNKGISLDALGRPQEALRCYGQALVIDPRHANAWYNKGVSLAGRDRFEEALKCFDKALAIDPGNANAWCNKGRSLTALGRPEEALRCIDQALEIEPRRADAWLHKGVALAHLGRREEKIACYDQALAIDSRYAMAWGMKGNSLDALGRREEALRCYDRALAIDPQNADVWFCRGHSLHDLGRREEALEAYDQVLAIDARHVDAWLGKAKLEDDMKHWDEALRSYREFLELALPRAGPKTHLGMILIRIRELEIILSHGGEDITKW